MKKNIDVSADQLVAIIEHLRVTMSPDSLDVAEEQMKPIAAYDPILGQLLRESADASRRIGIYLQKRHFDKNAN